MFSLGGLDENGKNMFVIEVDKNIFVFEAGLKYADELTLGIDYIIPNITYLKENKKRIKGIFLTHGHDENIGALSDIVDDLDNPMIYGSKYTLEAVKREFETYNISYKNLKEIKAYIPIIIIKIYNTFNIFFKRVKTSFTFFLSISTSSFVFFLLNIIHLAFIIITHLLFYLH